MRVAGVGVDGCSMVAPKVCFSASIVGNEVVHDDEVRFVWVLERAIESNWGEATAQQAVQGG